MSYSVDRPWKPGQDDDVAGVERLLDPGGADVDDPALPCWVSVMIPACEPV
jgi:hypothetical protein